GAAMRADVEVVLDGSAAALAGICGQLQLVEDRLRLQRALVGIGDGCLRPYDQINDQAWQVEYGHQDHSNKLRRLVVGAILYVAVGPDNGAEPEHQRVGNEHQRDQLDRGLNATAGPTNKQ